MKIRNISLALFALITSTSFAAPPKLEFEISHQNGSVEFNAIGRPSALKIHGQGGAPTGHFEVVGKVLSGLASFKLESLETGIKMRNEHMKAKYLEIAKFPDAQLTLQNVNLPGELKNQTEYKDVPFSGTLKLHGVEKPVSGKAVLARDGKKVTVEASFDLKISEYSIPTPGFAGITMAEDVTAIVKFEALAK